MSTVGREPTMTEAWRSIVDERKTIIAIWGIGGVGKTALLKQIYSKLTISPLHFDTVIWVTVSQKISVQKVQNDIWRSIGVFNVEWVDKTFEEKSKAIFEVLSKKQFLLLLDDLGKEVNLTKLGVPYPNSQRNKCKVIFTSRSYGACLRMEAKVIIRVVPLEWKNAWELFKNKVGEDRLTEPRIVEVAQAIAETCNGLPMSLCTVGRAMSNMTTYDEWLGAIRGVKFQEDDEREKTFVFTLLNLCFACLDRKVRSCLLFYCMFPEDFTILKNDLIDFWICEPALFFSREVDALNLGYQTVDALIGAGLLEEEEVNSVKVLDLIRNFGIKHQSYTDHFINIGIRRVVGHILAMRNSIHHLVDYIPNSLVLNFLLNHNPFIITNAHLRRRNEDQITSGSIFSTNEDQITNRSIFSTEKGKKSSGIEEDLHLSRSSKQAKRRTFLIYKGINTPHQFIDSITVLDLSNSGVEKLPREIAELVSLKYLNLSGTWIDHLPIEVKKLVKLQCLNLEYIDQLRVIPKQLILELPFLRILKMFRCGFSVEQIEDNILSLTHMDIDPILCLMFLNVLSLTITCALSLHKLFSSRRLLQCTQSLSLEVFWGSKSVDISRLAAMQNLLLLEIHQCEDLSELKCYPHQFELERRRSFGKLREITLDRCASLVEVTWVSLVPNLTILKLQNCDEMEEVISNRRTGETCEGDNWEPFAKLEILTLKNLPELKSIYWKTLPFQSLKKIEVSNCSVLKKLPLDSRSANTNELLVIKGEEDWWNNIEWEDDDSRLTFLPCFKPIDD
ncbi:Disease resistance protein (CC-NBS-LRR class) family [Euphorbia peplus]|nr:Disease resistance protein (CC-NBS-LRR class) family [Euphorbia peplus]